MISIMKSKELSFKTFKNSNLFIKIMYFTKVQTIETFKEIYADDLKELFGQKKIKDELFKSHVQSLIEAKLLNPNKVKAWVNPF